MGDPKKHRKKYETPAHPWQRTRMEEESKIRAEFGLKTKREIWKLRSKWRGWARQAKKLNALETSQSELEKQQLLSKLHKLGLVEKNSTLNDVLDIELKDIFQRRLQSIVIAKKLARTMKQARQFITHQHIAIGGTTVTSPSYLVSTDEEAVVSFIPKSTLANLDHPERQNETTTEPQK